MAVTINLLPSELKVSKGLSRALSIVRMIGVISLAAFLIFGLGVGAFFIYSTIQLNNLNTSNANLKNQLSQLNETEQQFFVLKDRLSKIQVVDGLPSATDSLVKFETYIKPLTASNVVELDVNPGKISSTINFDSNSDMSGFINSISSSDYASVVFSSFAFSPTGGYLINMDAAEK